jgi:hypothetical protein
VQFLVEIGVSNTISSSGHFFDLRERLCSAERCDLSFSQDFRNGAKVLSGEISTAGTIACNTSRPSVTGRYVAAAAIWAIYIVRRVGSPGHSRRFSAKITWGSWRCAR